MMMSICHAKKRPWFSPISTEIATCPWLRDARSLFEGAAEFLQVLASTQVSSAQVSSAQPKQQGPVIDGVHENVSA